MSDTVIEEKKEKKVKRRPGRPRKNPLKTPVKAHTHCFGPTGLPDSQSSAKGSW